MTLFRKESVDHRVNRLHGEVLLNISISSRLTVLSLLLIFILAGAWVVMGHYARIEVAPGLLITDIPSSKVIAQVPGIVSQLDVKEGSLVQKGDRLALIDLDRRAQKAGSGFAGQGLAAIDSRMVLGEQRILLTERRAQAEQERVNSVLDTAKQQSIGLVGQIKIQREIVASNRRLYEQIAGVVERGFVSRVEFERRHQTVLNSEKELGELQQQLVSRHADASQAQAQLAGLRLQAASDVSDIHSSMQSLTQQRAELSGEQYYAVTAPISGRVTVLQIAEGHTTSGQTPLMIIVPQQSTLRAEIYAPSRAIGFVHPGQEARLLYDAFPYQRFGSFGGRITSVSRTVIDPRETDAPLKLDEPVYRVTVKLQQQNVRAFGEVLALQPGMTFKANLILERQSFLDWLLAPLRAVGNRT